MALYSFIAEEKACAESPWSTAQLCEVLGVSRSGFYDWQRRPPSETELSSRQLAGEIEAIFIASDQTYGAPRVHHWLTRQGFKVGHNRVARIMRENNWVGQIGRPPRVRTTVADPKAVPAPDRLRRDFNPPAPDVAWAGDITYIDTGQGWLYLATVIDLYSRRVIGWSLADHLRASACCDALAMAAATRGGAVSGVVFHSDRGCQYTSAEFRRRCEALGISQSMGRTGTALDNAAAESFFATLKKELVHRYRWLEHADARRAIVRWIEGWYNARRLHSSLGYRTPTEAEDHWWAAQNDKRRAGRHAA